MKATLKKVAVPLAIASMGLGVAVPMATTAFASGSNKTAAASTTYTTTLGALNGSGASGTVKIVLTGDVAVITEHTEGLAATFNGDPYPHVQHIHIDGMGQCPSPSADTSGDGVISTTEGQPAYGTIGTSLTTSGDTSPKAAVALNVAPSGAGYDYSRTITLDSATVSSLEAGTAVVVVHGLDPATLSTEAQGEPSDIVPSLPLAATSPALCGVLAAQAAAPTTVPGTTAPTPPTTMAPASPAAPMPMQPTFTG